MDYLNVHIPLLKSDLFTDADNADLGIWLRLAAYCAQQENGGHILGCADWNDRKWLTAVGVTRGDVMRESPLWKWAVAQPGVLWVTGYPVEQEAKLKAQRLGGKNGANKRWRKRKKPPENGSSDSSNDGLSDR